MNSLPKADKQLSSLISRIGHRDEGFSMISAIMALMVGTLLSLAAWATANSDINFTDKDKWSRLAYQRAQSGISDYVQHMAEDSGYWKACDRPDGVTGDGLGQTAVNDNDFGASGHSTRRWLPYSAAGSVTDRSYNTQYTIDLQPITGSCKPSATAADRMIDPASGTFRITVTGRAGPLVPSNLTATQIEAWRQNNWRRVTLVSEFRRNGFLDYGYFTDKEGQDPGLQTATLADPTRCDAYYQDNPGYTTSLPISETNVAGRWRASSPNNCQEIMFANGDRLQGPFHTNDSVLLESLGTGGALFGNANKGDRIEVYDNNKGNCPFRTQDVTLSDSTVTPTYCTKTNIRKNTGVTLVTGAAARYLDLPEENDDLVTYADPYSGDPSSQGYTFLGKTAITLNANNTFDVVNDLVNGGASTNYPFPTSGVIYVANNGVTSCQANISAKYPGLAAGCALAEVRGTYNKSLTIGSEADIVITADIVRGSSQVAVLGLIANQYVRVRHYMRTSTDYNYGTGGSSCYRDNVGQGSPVVSNVQAAILALKHSFTVDGYRCGTSMGNLNFTGVLAQRFRGAVGQGSAGYSKNYAYDYTFKSQTPPHFLAPSAATWKIIRQRQTLPPCECKWNG